MKFYEEIRRDTLIRVAEKMLVAAKTAPKGRGIDNLVGAYLIKKDIDILVEKMKEIGNREGMEALFARDAANISNCEVVVLLGIKIANTGLKYCGLCGFPDCSEKNLHPENPCTFNTTDLGIALGSAVSKASEERVDNRIMYTIGMAAKEMQLLGEDVKIVFGIPLSASSKNPFFDR